MKNQKIDLSGIWNLSCDALNLHIKGEVPGSIYQDLLSANVIPDPFDQDNEYMVREFMNHDYTYEREITLTEAQVFHKNFVLVMKGIDTLAEIFVNNRLIAETDNMHRIYPVDVSKFIKPGRNHFKVVIKSCLRYIRNAENEYPYPLYQAGDSVKGYIHLRKAHYMFGWDWGPQLPDGGIWRDIYLLSTEHALINDFLITQSHKQKSVELRLEPDFRVFDNTSIHWGFSLLDPNGSLVEERTQIKADEKVDISIENPLKWYPVNYGNAHLYKLKIQLYFQQEILEEKTIHIGLREVVLNQVSDSYGESFTFQVNGISIFAKGANYIPEDNLLARTSKAKTAELLSAAKQANQNMIRVWGGGIYPADYFYDLCDQLGLLVWQDLMFACSVYPMDNDRFVETTKQELIDNLTRIRNHPSVVLICGNNENETAIENWHVPSLEISKQFYEKQYMEIIPEIVREYYPNIPYWRSSPASKTLFSDTNSDRFGDMHYWGVWHNNEPFTNYRKYFPRFMSEFGLQSFPAIETINSFAREEDKNIFSYIMEQHQKNKTANSKILDYIGKLFKYPKNFESLLYVSQAIQAEGIKYGVEHWRRHYGRCMGILYWQLNDCWPVASWSSIDYFHRWKALHFAAKKFYAPVLISIEESIDLAKICVTNDRLEPFTGDYTYEWLDFAGNLLQKNQGIISAKAQSATWIIDVKLNYDKNELKDKFLYVKLSSQAGMISENTVFFVPDKHLHLMVPKISYQVSFMNGHYYLSLSTDSLAKFVEVKITGEDIVFSDNYFHLIPGKEKVISFETRTDIDSIIARVTIKSLIDSF